MTALVVELVGLPGSGKTAVAQATRATLCARGVPAVVADEPISAAVGRTPRMLRRTSAAVMTALHRPVWTASAAAAIAAVHQPSRRDTASVVAQWLALCHLTSRARDAAGVQLLEEGPLQTLWTLLLRSPDPLPAGLLSSWPHAARIDLVVVLDVPLDVVEARLTGRASKHSRSQQLAPEGLRAELVRGRRLVDDLAAATTSPVLRLRAGGDTTACGLGTDLAGILSDVDG